VTINIKKTTNVGKYKAVIGCVDVMGLHTLTDLDRCRCHSTYHSNERRQQDWVAKGAQDSVAHRNVRLIFFALLHAILYGGFHRH